MLELWLIRHGETDFNAQGRILGRADMPLSAAGATQARRLGRRIAQLALPFDGVYASDLTRARVTAETAFPMERVRLDERLRELDYGVFEGESWDRLGDELAVLARRWREDPYGRRIPRGESYDDVIERFEAFRAELPHDGRVAAVSHGGTIRCALYGAMGRPPRGTWQLELDNTSITRLRYDGRGRAVTLVGLNDRAHLDLRR